MRVISVFFRTVEPARLSDPGAQLSAVVAFKKELEEKKHLLFQQFEDINEFEGALRMFLASWVRQHEMELAGNGDAEGGSRRSVQGGGRGEPMPAITAAPRLTEDTNEDPAPAPGSPLEAAAHLAAEGRYTEAETLYWEVKLGAQRQAIGEALTEVGNQPHAVARWLASHHKSHERPGEQRAQG